MLCGPAKRFDLINIGYRTPETHYEIKNFTGKGDMGWSKNLS